MIAKLLFLLVFISNNFILSQITYQGIGSTDVSEENEEFKSMDMNTAFLVILSNKYIKVYAIIQPMILKELLFLDKLEIKDYSEINLIINKIFAIGNNGIDVFELREGRITRTNEIMERDALNVQQDIERQRFYIYKNSGNAIYDYNFKKVIENNIKEDKFNFLKAFKNEGLYKDEKGNKYIINFSDKSYSIEPLKLKGEVIFFEGKKFFWILEDSILLKMYKDLKNELTINILKDINEFLNKEKSEKVKKVKIKDLLISYIYDYIYLVADVFMENNLKKQCTLIYYYTEGSYKLCNIKSTNEWKSIKTKINKFYNIAFLSKNDIFFSKDKYYSCEFLEDIKNK